VDNDKLKRLQVRNFNTIKSFLNNLKNIKILKYLLEFELKRLERRWMDLERVRAKWKLENKINNLEKKIEKETDDVKLKRFNVKF
jgi:hypothetical protein